MISFWTFIYKNIQWIFSGVGNLFLNFFSNKKKDVAATNFHTSLKGDSIKAKVKKGGSITDNRSITTNITNGFSMPQVIDLVKTLSDQKIQQNLGIARQEIIRPINLYKDEFLKTTESRLMPDDYNAFKKPDVLFVLGNSFSIAARKDSPKWRELLSNLIVERIKCDSIDSASIIYNDAINSISHLTSNQIRLLSILDITSSLIFSIINSEILFTEFELLETFLNEPYILTNTDIDQLKYCRLIYSTFPHEIDRSTLNSSTNIRLVRIIRKCQEIIEPFAQFSLNQFQLSPVGYAVSQTNLSLILNTEINHLSKAPLQLADLEVRRMFAQEGGFNGNVTAYTKKNY